MGKTTAGPPFLDKTLWEQTLRLKPRRGEKLLADFPTKVQVAENLKYIIWI